MLPRDCSITCGRSMQRRSRTTAVGGTCVPTVNSYQSPIAVTTISLASRGGEFALAVTCPCDKCRSQRSKRVGYAMISFTTFPATSVRRSGNRIAPVLRIRLATGATDRALDLQPKRRTAQIGIQLATCDQDCVTDGFGRRHRFDIRQSLRSATIELDGILAVAVIHRVSVFQYAASPAGNDHVRELGRSPRHSDLGFSGQFRGTLHRTGRFASAPETEAACERQVISGRTEGPSVCLGCFP